MASADGEIGEPLNPEPPSPAAGQHEVKKDTRTCGDAFLTAYRTLSIVTAISAVLCGVANLVSAVRSFKYGEDMKLVLNFLVRLLWPRAVSGAMVSVFVGILRCYGVVLALFVAIAETEWERIFKFWRVLEYWVFRGMLQIFIAVMTKALSHASGESELETELHKIASWALFGCGIVYILSGILCIGNLKKSRARKAHWREQAIKELEEVERKRKELKGLLSDQV